MKIKFTYIDKNSRVSISEIPCSPEYVPDFPEIKGLEFDFAEESQYGISRYPVFYGSCDDNADINISGVLGILTDEEYSSAKELEFSIRKNNKEIQVNDEIQRLLNEVQQLEGETWSEYRQSLRDIPNQEEFPWNIIFPTKPNN